MKSYRIIIALTMGLLAVSAQAETITWINSGSAAWNNAASWDLNRAPANGDTANIPLGTVEFPGADLNFTGTINFSGTGQYSQTTTNWMRLYSGEMTLSDTAIFSCGANGLFMGASNGATYNLTLNGSSQFKSTANNNNTAGLKIATNADSDSATGITANVTLNNQSSFSAAKIFLLGDGAGNTANFTVNDSAKFDVTGTLTLGSNNGVGHVYLKGGTTNLATTTINANSTLEISGGTNTFSNKLTLNNDAILTASSGSMETNGEVSLEGNSKMNLSGADFTAGSPVHARGNSELNISAGTIKINKTLNGGRADGSNAKINISGTADVTIADDVWLGYQTTGKVAMSISGGKVSMATTGHNININGSNSSGSSLSISGGTTTLTGGINNKYDGVLSISGVDGSLTCGTMTLADTSQTIISGSTVTVTGKLSMTQTASFELSGGSFTVGGDFDTASGTGLKLTFTGSDYTAQLKKLAGGMASNAWTFNLDSNGIAPINVTTGAYLGGTAHFNLPSDGFNVLNQTEFTLITAGETLSNNITIDAASPFKFTNSNAKNVTIAFDEDKIANKWSATSNNPYIIPTELGEIGEVGVKKGEDNLGDLLFYYDGGLGNATEENLIDFLNECLETTPFSFSAYGDKTLELEGTPITDNIIMLNWNLADFNTNYESGIYFSQLSAVANPSVPEPSTWALLILGALGLVVSSIYICG